MMTRGLKARESSWDRVIEDYYGGVLFLLSLVIWETLFKVNLPIVRHLVVNSDACEWFFFFGAVTEISSIVQII